MLFCYTPLPLNVQTNLHGEGFDAPPTLERSGYEHRRAVTSFLLRRKAWLEVELPLAKGRRRDSKKITSIFLGPPFLLILKRTFKVLQHLMFRILLGKISVFRRNAPIDTERIIQYRDSTISLWVTKSYYSTVTLFARFLGISTSSPLSTAT